MRETEEWKRPYIAAVSFAGALCTVTSFVLIGNIPWVACVFLALAILCLYTGVKIIRGTLK